MKFVSVSSEIFRDYWMLQQDDILAAQHEYKNYKNLVFHFSHFKNKLQNNFVFLCAFEKNNCRYFKTVISKAKVFAKLFPQKVLPIVTIKSTFTK